MWDYDFKIQFTTTGDDNYIRVPLSTFASNYVISGGLCSIFVEYLDPTDDDSSQIILGGMFFQSIYARYSLTTTSSTIQLYANTNALPGTYVGNQAVTESPDSAFSVNPLTIHTDPYSEQNGLPYFRANITGVDDASAYYLMDFSTDHTVVWNVDCMQTGIGNYPEGSCEGSPTKLSSAFNQSSSTDGIIR